jgi:hypothetical protein
LGFTDSTNLAIESSDSGTARGHLKTMLHTGKNIKAHINASFPGKLCQPQAVIQKRDLLSNCYASQPL